MFYIAIFNSKEVNILEHCKSVMSSLLILLMDCTDDFDNYTHEEFSNLAEDWDYHKLIECMRKYNIPINKLADCVVDPKYELAGLFISICSNSKHLQKTLLKSIKRYMSKYDKSSEEYTNMRKFYGRTRMSDNPVSLVETFNLMNNKFSEGDITNAKLFYDFDEYLEYIFDR